MNYVTRSTEGIYIGGTNKIEKIGLIRYINNLCINNISTYEGRKQAAKKMLKRNKLVPIYINKNIILFPTSSIRILDMYFINYLKIINVYEQGKTSIIYFTDGTSLTVSIPKKNIVSMMKLCEQLLTNNKD